MNPESCQGATVSFSSLIPEDSWKRLKDIYSGRQPEDVFVFTNAQMISYFVERTLADGEPANDVKALNNSAMSLFRCGHIQDIMISQANGFLNLHTKCMPEMKKDKMYLDPDILAIVGAECGCPAGKGPHASCKHIGALCYALEEFSRFGKIPGFLTCTDQLQCWGIPREKKLDIIPVSGLSLRKCELMKENCNKKSRSVFDPRPLEYRTMDSKALEEFRCGLLSFGEPSAFLDILLPPEKKIKHDHTYSLPPQSEHETNWALLPSIEESSTFEDNELPVVQSDEMTLQCLLVKLNLRVTPHER